ncbi:MAG: JAB domain-containing protein [Flavobacterium sp.]|uniref:JAB domain-containing protein n=1 Tax=Flavobacterium sp. TaxID=239 RepID=UPI003BECE233
MNPLKNNIIPTVSEIEVSYRPAISNKPIITSSLDAYTVLKDFISLNTIALQEHFVVMYLNRANRVLGVYKLSNGGITGTVADPRLILGIALKIAATGIILAHNHPSGNLKASSADLELTKKIKTAASFMDIMVTDHIILSVNCEYFSFADEGLI